MHAYPPTTIKMHSNHCPWAVQLWKNRIPYDRSIFHTGVVAHRVLEDIGNYPNKEPKIIADNVVEKYCSEGRAYDNVPEPPAPFTDALEGAKLALEWHRIHPVPHGDGITHEHPFAYTQNWTEHPGSLHTMNWIHSNVNAKLSSSGSNTNQMYSSWKSLTSE